MLSTMRTGCIAPLSYSRRIAHNPGMKKRILARARKALLANRVEEGRKLANLAFELRTIRYGPETVHVGAR